MDEAGAAPTVPPVNNSSSQYIWWSDIKFMVPEDES